MNPFADYTRSTAFSLSLSAKMIDRILIRATVDDLATRYPWWTGPRWSSRPGDTGLADFTDSTSNALARRGLIEWIECPCANGQAGARESLTPAGSALAELLRLAEFTTTWRAAGMGAIPAHPDDCDDFGYRPRRKLEWVRIGTEPPTLKSVERELEWPRDRRLDLWQPGDEEHWEPVALPDRDELAAMVAAAKAKDEVPADA